MISVLFKRIIANVKFSQGTVNHKGVVYIVVIEELLFWTGLAALMFGTGWFAAVGGVAVLVAIVLALWLFVYT